jgi:hypothetical protein
VPLHDPLQPVNVEPVAGVAASVTLLPKFSVAAHVAPQSILPAGTLVTVPLPVPTFVTASANVFNANVAVTFFTASIVTTQLPAPLHAPLQPVNVEPVAGVAASVTLLL